MARIKLNYSLVFLMLCMVSTNVVIGTGKSDLKLLLQYRKFVDKQLLKEPCKHDHYLLPNGQIIQDYTSWNKEIATVRNIANYLTSMWSFKDDKNHSLVESEQMIYTLVKSITLSSDQIHGSVICFDENKFQGRRQFCPYAFLNRTNQTVVKDFGIAHDYLTAPEWNQRFNKDNFTWWRVGQKFFSNATLAETTVYYDVDLHETLQPRDNQSMNKHSQYYGITSYYVSTTLGKWTTPYYACFGGKIWMFTYLVPFYDEKSKFLGVVSFDIKLDSIEINECDAPTTQPNMDVPSIQFYGNHQCQNTTKCVHVPGGGFTVGSYRCICRNGFYFPRLNAKKKYFDGKDILAAKKWNRSMFNCLPCREGCDDCVDDKPCMYQRNIALRKTFLAANEIIKFLAVMAGVFIFVNRESKIIKASSPVFMEIIASGIILMYFEITLGYFEDSVRLCIARSWIYHIGFVLSFGSLLLKTWRIAVIFRLRTTKMIELTDVTLVKYLILMVLAVACYLMIWTWTQTHEFEVATTSSGYKYKRCVREWFSNAIEIGEVLFLLCGVWLCLRVRNAPSAYNESKYIAWCIYNSVFIMILVGLLRIVLDNFHNPDVSYVVDFLSTHVIATIMLTLLFASKIYLLRKFKKDNRRHTRSNSTTLTNTTEHRKSPFHLNRLVDGTLVCDNDDEKTFERLEIENVQLREEIRDLSAKLAACESKQQRERRKYGNKNGDVHYQRQRSLTEDTRDMQLESFGDNRRKKSEAAESTTSNSSVFVRDEKRGSLLDDIKKAGTQEKFLAIPKENSISDEETLTVISNISNESS